MKVIATKIFDTISIAALVIGTIAMLLDMFSPFLNDNENLRFFHEWFHLFSFCALFIFMLLSGWLKKSMPIIILLFVCNVGFSQIFFNKKQQIKLPPNEIGSLDLKIKTKLDKKLSLIHI